MNETYHSFHGALRESLHVFIEKGLEDFTAKNNKQQLNILEIGLGTGLNVLLTADWALKHQKNIQFTSLEAYPLPTTLALQLNYPKFISTSQASTWFSVIHESPWGSRVKVSEWLTLFKVKGRLEEFRPLEMYDIVFFDAFAPNKQGELWEYEILKKVYESQSNGGYFVTYSAKGQLKRDLAALGYLQETLPGPPGKKEMVRGIKV